jgi:hypothetical protein
MRSGGSYSISLLRSGRKGHARTFPRVLRGVLSSDDPVDLQERCRECAAHGAFHDQHPYLMTAVLGYDRYLAQGSDWGSAVSAWMGYNHGSNTGGACAGVHLNMVSTRAAGMIARTDEEREWEATRAKLHRREGAYFELQSTKPQSLAYAMMDSPVGVAAWIVDKFAAWSDLPKAAEGSPDLLARYTRDQLLTNIMLYLVTGSFPTSTWMYKACLRTSRSALYPARGSRCRWAWRHFRIRCLCLRPAVGRSVPTMLCIGR